MRRGAPHLFIFESLSEGLFSGEDIVGGAVEKVVRSRVFVEPETVCEGDRWG